MGLGHIAAQIEADNRARVLAETFGHLAPENGKVYTGSILFAHSGYGYGTGPISADFEELPDSPWFYEAMCEFLDEHASPANEGKVFRWTGTYVLNLWPRVWNEDESDIVEESGHEHLFTGEIREIPTK